MEDNTNIDVNSTDASKVEETQNKKMYSEDELNSLLDSRISKAYEKWNKKQSKAVEEAQKLARMDEEERAKYETEKKISEYEKKLADYQKLEFKATALETMGNRNLPTQFADMLIGEDADTTLENIKNFESVFKAAVQDEVNKRLKGNVPTTSASGTKQTGLTKEEFKKLPLSEKQKIYATNKELYNSLAH